MDLVDHDLEVHRVAGVGVDRCGVWQRTQSLTSWRDPPWAESGIVAVVAGAVAIMSQVRSRLRVGTKIVFDVGVVVLSDDRGQVAGRVDAERRGLGLSYPAGRALPNL